ncbi:MAG: DUF4863 family protein [Stappiaceae bacterium]
MPQERFIETISKIAEHIAGRPLDVELENFLNDEFPTGSDAFETLRKLCVEGEADGWLMAREAGNIKFGRAIKPGTDAGVFSVDVVRMKDVRGPHHVHTTGEIGAIFPLEGNPKFDGKPEGWYVYGPGTNHHPTVTGGDAHILYLLPGGEIEFTGK